MQRLKTEDAKGQEGDCLATILSFLNRILKVGRNDGCLLRNPEVLEYGQQPGNGRLGKENLITKLAKIESDKLT